MTYERPAIVERIEIVAHLNTDSWSDDGGDVSSH